MKKSLLAVAAVLFGMNISAQNLISNSTFDTDATGWAQYTRNGGSIAIFQVEEGILHVKSNGAGDNAIDANLKNRFNGGVYIALPSLAAQKYTLTLDICAVNTAATRTFSVAILKDVDLSADGATTTENNVYLPSAQTINAITEGMALKTLRFDITLADAAEKAVLALGFTANSAEWYIDNIYLTPAYLGNPGFETTYNWSKNGGMTWAQDDTEDNVHGGTKSGKYTPTPDLEKEFYQCRSQAPVTYLKATDNKVTVRFWAKGAEGGEVVYGIFYDGDKESQALGLGDYVAEDKKSPKEGIPMATLTTEWAPYTFVFEGTDNMVTPYLAFSSNETGKTFWIDDIVMFAENDPTLGVSAPAVADNSGIKVFAAASQVFVASDAAATVNVYSMTTGVLFDSKQITEGNTVIDLAKGAYIIQVVTNGKSVSEKVIIR
ncbi:T9SS type A sorting domain-containing protein [Coprobacter fastidiosus]|uniref:T9SS type A sorting domain-containing protein n=1 Tax=Coprobacter fastidiosus TaxID=1099853 RepID=UPI001DABA710|nr:T9SS type A sorting domain-containing protein [Coprobacter fastidiosus]HJF42687.1 T9SS type A sorting domain-containing protein [Coprobacter fastidiosus]